MDELRTLLEDIKERLVRIENILLGNGQEASPGLWPSHAPSSTSRFALEGLSAARKWPAWGIVEERSVGG